MKFYHKSVFDEVLRKPGRFAKTWCTTANKGKNVSVCYSHHILECQVTLNFVLVGHYSLSTEVAEKKRTVNQQSLTRKIKN